MVTLTRCLLAVVVGVVLSVLLSIIFLNSAHASEGVSHYCINESAAVTVAEVQSEHDLESALSTFDYLNRMRLCYTEFLRFDIMREVLNLPTKSEDNPGQPGPGIAVYEIRTTFNGVIVTYYLIATPRGKAQ